MSNKQPCVVIHSVREDGERFRPGDWIERISSNGASFGPDRRLRYTSAVHPVIVEGERCLAVNGSLADTSPVLFQYIMDFARRNRLKMEQASCSQDILAWAVRQSELQTGPQ